MRHAGRAICWCRCWGQAWPDVTQPFRILAPWGRDATVIQRVLERAGVAAAKHDTLAALTLELGNAAGVVVTEEALAGPDLPALLMQVALQPAWSDLSFIVLTTKQNGPPSAVQLAMLEALGNAMLLERPLNADTLARAVRAVARARVRQLGVRDLNATLEQRVADRTAALRRSEADLRAVFDGFPDGLFLLNITPDGPVFEAFNSFAEQVSGQRSENVQGQTIEAVLPSPRAQRLEHYVGECLRTRQTVRYSHQIADPTPGVRRDLILDMALTPILDSSEVITRVLGVARDVTNRTTLEVKLRQAQKMEAVGQLTGGVAHDFNNLLQVVMSGLALLERATDTSRRVQLMDSIRRAAMRGGELTKRLLTVARRQQLTPAAINLEIWLHDGIGELMTRAMPSDINIAMDIEPGLPPVMVDPAEMELALINLAVNARDAMPSGGTLTIRAVFARLSAATDPDGLEGEFVQLSVGDNGTGMSAETQARVFEPFFTTKGIGQGTGLGLAQVYGFARQSGGMARLYSVEGQGTTVMLFLPTSADAAANTADPPAAVPGTSLGYAVLVCEDDEDVAALVVDMLRQLGHIPTRVAGASAALVALAHDRRVDLLFTDVLMPGGMDGLALAREARRQRPGLPVLLTTGYTGGGPSAVPLGVPLLRKPYSLQDLQQAITRAMANG